jgi:hypothetical protein
MLLRRSALRLVLVLVVMVGILGLPTTSGAQTVNGLSAPAAGATVSGLVNVKGYAQSPNFEKWQLDLLPNGNANAPVFLALGAKPGVFTYTLNSALYPPGDQTLRLRVVRTDSNYDEYLTPVKFAK